MGNFNRARGIVSAAGLGAAHRSQFQPYVPPASERCAEPSFGGAWASTSPTAKIASALAAMAPCLPSWNTGGGQWRQGMINGVWYGAWKASARAPMLYYAFHPRS